MVNRKLKCNLYACAFAKFAIYLNRASEEIYDGLCNCHAKPSSLNLIYNRILCTRERFEDARLEFFAHSVSVIGNAKTQLAVIGLIARKLADVETNLSSVRCIFIRIAQKVDYNLAQSYGVSDIVFVSHTENADLEILAFIQET